MDGGLAGILIFFSASASPKTGIAVFAENKKKNVQGSYLRRISIHETLISRSICLLRAKITSDTPISISNPPSAWCASCPVIRCAGWVPDADGGVAGDLAQRRHMLLEMRVSWMLIFLRKVPHQNIRVSSEHKSKLRT